MMRRRVLTFLLAGLVVLGCVFGCVPMRAGAIVPLGLVQSALASYVTSTGYKMYNDQGTGQDIIDALSDLYRTWLQSPAAQALSIFTLTHLAEIEAVYLDNQSNIVVTADAAHVFQAFSSWIKNNYNVPIDGSPTYVLNPGAPIYNFPSYQTSGSVQVSSIIAASDLYQWAFTKTNSIDFSLSDSVSSAMSGFLMEHRNDAFCVEVFTSPTTAFGGWSPITVYACPIVGGELSLTSPTSSCIELETYGTGSGDGSLRVTNYRTYSNMRFPFVGQKEESKRYLCCNVNVTSVPGFHGLGVKLVQDVLDRAADLDQDDSLVVAVGAGVGATAEDIVDIVAQGIKAQTLDPSVTVVADAVIDTPVQPYPDIDSLGLPQLGAALVSRFPFCIPWDFVDTVKLLSADPVAPNIAVDLFPAAFKSKVGVTGSTEFRINLGDEKYQIIGTFCRWGSLISFCFGLALLTKRVIWTA